MVFANFDITDYILMIIVFILSIIIIKVVFGISSKKIRETYTTQIEYCLLIGFFLGIILPWNETLGLFVALISVNIFLLFVLYSMFSMGVIGNIPLIAQSWLPREKIRVLFSYFSIVEGVMGIAGFVLPIIMSSVFSFQMITTITPLALTSISILADLFDLTFPTPPYHELFTLIYRYYLKYRYNLTNKEDFLIEDTQFPFILENTDFTVYELREALELLVRESMAERTLPSTPMGRISFIVNTSGIESIKLEYEEKMLRLNTEKKGITKVLDYFDSEETIKSLDTQKKFKKALKILAKTDKMSKELFRRECFFLEKNWLDSILSRIEEQRKLLISKNKRKDDK